MIPPGKNAAGRAPAPILDAEIDHALAALKRHPSGLTRADLGRLFASDRRGRDVIAALAERGIAAIVNVESEIHSGSKVYRLARSEEEVQHEERRLLAYEESCRRRRLGLRAAYRKGAEPTAPQTAPFASKELT